MLATVSKSAGNFERRDQSNGWDGNFAAGDELLWTQGAGGPIFVNFNGAALTAAGTQIQNQPYGPFSATISVRDGVGNPLASFNVLGDSTDSANPPAIFVGVLATGGDTFARVTFSTPSGSTAINQLDFTLAPAAVPAPAGLVLLACAAVPALGLRRLVRRKAS